MPDNHYQSDGINISYGDDDGAATWRGELEFFDHYVVNPEMGAVKTGGRLFAEYDVPSGGTHPYAVHRVTKTLIEDASRMDIEFVDPVIEADPESAMPDGWPELLESEAGYLGWPSRYPRKTR